MGTSGSLATSSTSPADSTVPVHAADWAPQDRALCCGARWWVPRHTTAGDRAGGAPQDAAGGAPAHATGGAPRDAVGAVPDEAHGGAPH